MQCSIWQRYLRNDTYYHTGDNRYITFNDSQSKIKLLNASTLPLSVIQVTKSEWVSFIIRENDRVAAFVTICKVTATNSVILCWRKSVRSSTKVHIATTANYMNIIHQHHSTKVSFKVCSHNTRAKKLEGSVLLPHSFFWGRWVPKHNVARSKAYLHTKFDLHPPNRLATIHQRYRQTGQTRQQSDGIGRTVLQMVTQKSFQAGLWGT